MDAGGSLSKAERDIAETRERIKTHLDELVEELAPTAIVEAALPHITGVSGAQFTEALIARVKRNPAAALLIVAGVVWLFGLRSPSP